MADLSKAAFLTTVLDFFYYSRYIIIQSLIRIRAIYYI
jgi:hypothetical protein